MKCRKCGDKAVINMRQHKLALCRFHFSDWIPEQTQRFIEKYHMFQPKDHILIAVSGGKDSLSLWEILSRLGYTTTGLHIDLGIDERIGYSKKSRFLTTKFATDRNLNYRIVDFSADYGESIPALSENSRRGRGKPCSVCGLSKRHILNRYAFENGFNILATGHNLDDEVAILFGNTLN